MVEIYNKLKELSAEKKDIELLHNPPFIIGCTISETHRLLYFKSAAPNVVFVDFIPQEVSANVLLFIPADQLLYLPEMDMECYCMPIPQSCLSELQYTCLMRLIYQKIKTMKIGAIDPAHFDPDKLFNTLFRSAPSLLRSLPSHQYVQKATTLMEVLKNINIDFQLNLNQLAAAIHVSEKTLYRITKSVFNLSPSQLLNYYLQLKIIFRITTHKLHSFFDIADDLKCPDVSIFSRYVKTRYGLTPTEIRNKFYHLQL